MYLWCSQCMYSEDLFLPLAVHPQPWIAHTSPTPGNEAFEGGSGIFRKYRPNDKDSSRRTRAMSFSQSSEKSVYHMFMTFSVGVSLCCFLSELVFDTCVIKTKEDEVQIKFKYKY